MATHLGRPSSSSIPRVPLRPFSGRARLRQSEPQATCANLTPPSVLQAGLSVTSGDGQERLVEELLPLVKRMALKIHKRLPAHIEVDDLVGAGSLGLLDALRKFDPRKRTKVETYVRHRICGAMLDSLRSLDGASRDMRQKNKRVEKVYRELEAKLGHAVGDGEMARELELSLEEWYRTIQQLQACGVDWLRPMAWPGSKYPSEETWIAENQETPFDHTYRLEKRQILRSARAGLPERERLILSLYYDQALTMKQIAARMRIHESRISQLHSAALVRLRKRVNATLRGPLPSTAAR